jgi:hypothetical protein
MTCGSVVVVGACDRRAAVGRLVFAVEEDLGADLAAKDHGRLPRIEEAGADMDSVHTAPDYLPTED